MKLLLTGSRNYGDKTKMKAAIENYLNELAELETLTGLTEKLELLHGGAKGADQLAQEIADELELPATVIRPDYKKHYWKAAPLRRNAELIEAADVVFAFYAAGKDRKGGTWDTVQKALAAGKPTTEHLSNGRTYTTIPADTLRLV